MDLQIREIGSINEMAEVYNLTYREYVASRYTEIRADEELRHYIHLDGIPETTVLGCYVHGKLVGTNSLTVDGPMGVHVDEDFPDTTARIRRWCHSQHLHLGSSWRIVTDRCVRHNVRILIELVKATVKKGCELGLHVTVYTFNPSHERAYRKFLGLETIARDVCRAAGGAPAALMLGDSRVITARCPKLGLDCCTQCNPPRWPALAGRWTGETR